MLRYGRRATGGRVAVARAIGALWLLGAALAMGSAPPAAAGGGDWLETVRDRYDPGDRVLAVGYTSGDVAGGPYHAYLRLDPDAAARQDDDQWPFVHPTDVRLGRLDLVPTGRADQFAVRASVVFTLPADLAPGQYEVVVCGEPCSRAPGNIIGGWVNVGVDPPPPSERDWLIDDPAVARLADHVLVSGVPVAQIRAGQAPVPWYDAPPPPPPSATEPTLPDRPAGAAERGAAARASATAPAGDGTVATSGDEDGGGWDAAVPWPVVPGALGVAAGAVWLRRRSARRAGRAWRAVRSTPARTRAPEGAAPDDAPPVIRLWGHYRQ